MADETVALGRVRAGDSHAFAGLRRCLEKPVRRFVTRLVGPCDGAEEIIQDVFVALWRNRHRLDAPERLRPFVFRVARNLAYDFLRRRGRRPALPLEGPSLLLPALGPTPDEALQGLWLRAEIDAAVARLPEPQRAALILQVEEDLSVDQIAEALSTEPGTVKSRLHYARRRLVRLLRPEAREALGLSVEENENGK